LWYFIWVVVKLIDLLCFALLFVVDGKLPLSLALRQKLISVVFVNNIFGGIVLAVSIIY